ncbi:hypothetical protein B0T09DRAFT_134552 [Sordaria sp. MPI-SDFR-AT-0083]|nr:hypothetical protein B0T09DRAFT_134552 [Sordaria sp. MPI-SDFR-AT-0083]
MFLTGRVLPLAGLGFSFFVYLAVRDLSTSSLALLHQSEFKSVGRTKGRKRGRHPSRNVASKTQQSGISPGRSRTELHKLCLTKPDNTYGKAGKEGKSSYSFPIFLTNKDEDHPSTGSSAHDGRPFTTIHIVPYRKANPRPHNVTDSRTAYLRYI